MCIVSEVNGFNELIENAAHELRRPVRFNPALDERVMKSVRAIPRFGRMANLVGWLLTTHPVRLSPAFGLVVLVGAAVGMWAWASSGAVPEQIASSFENGARMIVFSLEVPEASDVSIVGDFNDWDAEATPLSRTSALDEWAAAVPLVPGRYQYTFIVDGEQWVADPGAPRALQSDFGRPSSVITVPEL